MKFVLDAVHGGAFCLGVVFITNEVKEAVKAVDGGFLDERCVVVDALFLGYVWTYEDFAVVKRDDIRGRGIIEESIV